MLNRLGRPSLGSGRTFPSAKPSSLKTADGYPGPGSEGSAGSPGSPGWRFGALAADDLDSWSVAIGCPRAWVGMRWIPLSGGRHGCIAALALLSHLVSSQPDHLLPPLPSNIDKRVRVVEDDSSASRQIKISGLRVGRAQFQAQSCA